MVRTKESRMVINNKLIAQMLKYALKLIATGKINSKTLFDLRQK